MQGAGLVRTKVTAVFVKVVGHVVTDAFESQKYKFVAAALGIWKMNPSVPTLTIE